MIVRVRLAIGICLVAMLAGCATRPAAAPAPALPPPPTLAVPPAEPLPVEQPGIDYIDLEAGWRLRVVTPILKSGGYQLRPRETRTQGRTITVAGGDELEGYETAYYAVQPRDGEGVRIEFVSAEATREGVSVPAAQPRVMLFQLPAKANCVRLVFLARLSQTDHDMAVAAAASRDALAALTRALKKTGQAACADGENAFCSWIPGGIAVIPELRRTASGVEEWVPAR